MGPGFSDRKAPPTHHGVCVTNFAYLSRRLKDLVSVLVRPTGLLALGATVLLFSGLLIQNRILIALGVLPLGLCLLLIISRLQAGWTRAASSKQSDQTPYSPPTTPQPLQLTDSSESQTRAALQILTGEDSEAPLVTIVVPVFNEERFLAECLESLVAQSWTSWQCVVVDDASTDGSLTIARQFAKSDPRISSVRHYVNSGLPASRNTGLRITTTPWITFLDADDFLLADSLKDRLLTASSVTDDTMAGVYCGVRQYPEEVSLDEFPPSLPWNPPPFHDYLSSRGECPFNAHAPIVRTDIVTAFGGFDESMLQGAEDWKLWLRIMRAGYHFLPSKLLTAVYRQKRRSMVRTMPSGHLEEAEQLLASIHETLGDDPAIRSGPFPYIEPISVYDNQLAMTKRVVGYAGMASLADNESEEEAALEGLPDRLPTGWERHIEVERILNASYQRGLAVDEATYEALRPRLEPHIARIKTALISRDTAGLTRLEDIPARKGEAEIIFMPANAAQAKEMHRVASMLGRQAIFVVTDRWTGDQGVSQVTMDAGIRTQSLHTATSTVKSLGAVVTGYPTDSLIQGYATEAAMRGVPVFTLTSQIDRLEDAPPPVGTLVDVKALQSLLTQDRDRPGIPITLPPALWTSMGSLSTTEEAGSGPDSDQLVAFRNMHKGERVFIIGNGPSLNQMDLTKMAGENTIAVNGIFLAADKMNFSPTYYVVEDTSVMRENLDAIANYSAGHKFFPTIYRDLLPPNTNVTFFQMNRGFYAEESPHYCVPRFSTDAASALFSGQSVTIINLQLAYYMGFSEAILVGMDFSYTIPESAERTGDIIRSTQDDPNHFHPDYFGKGKTWKDPKLDRVLANYQLAKAIYEADGRKIVNATVGGRLEAFDRVDYNSLFS